MMRIVFLPLIFLAVGMVGWMFVSRRQFQRRNFAGVEEFSGFLSMVVTRFVERIIRFGSGAAIFMGLVGLVTAPGRMSPAERFGTVAAPVAASGVPAGARSAVLLSAKCYFYDRNHRLLRAQPADQSPRACLIPSATRA